MSIRVSEISHLDLLESVQMSRIAEGVSIPTSYSGFPTEVLIRIHLLPYIVPLKSERALAFEVAERSELRGAVGISGADAPVEVGVPARHILSALDALPEGCSQKFRIFFVAPPVQVEIAAASGEMRPEVLQRCTHPR